MNNAEKIISTIKSLDKLDRKRDALRVRLAYAKKCLCDEGDYAGVLYVSQVLDPKMRDKLFLQFLRRNSTYNALFVLAFAGDENSPAYVEAEEIAEELYEQNIYKIHEETAKEKDRVLCLFLDDYQDKDSLEWVCETIGKDTHFKAYEMVTSLLINQVNG